MYTAGELWNRQPSSIFPTSFDLKSFKSRVSGHLLFMDLDFDCSFLFLGGNMTAGFVPYLKNPGADIDDASSYRPISFLSYPFFPKFLSVLLQSDLFHIFIYVGKEEPRAEARCHVPPKK